MIMIQKDFTYSICWNLLQIVTGSMLSALALKGIALPHRFIPGGLMGVSSLIFYVSDIGNIASWYLFLNIPMFMLAWRGISRRFVWYSLFAMLTFTGSYWAMEVDLHVKNQLYGAVAGGMLSGLGVGLVLRSLGSNGGLDVLAVWLFQNYNIGIGRLYFVFNSLLFLVSLFFLEIDLVIASIIMVLCSSIALEQALSLFSQRKVVFIVSDRFDNIAREIQEKLKLGGTLLSGTGIYSRSEKPVLMTVINNIQLKRLEQAVFTIDEGALFIVENTFTVLGKSFSRRKIY